MATEQNILALPSGEHPWAKKLRRTRKLCARTERISTLSLTALLVARNAPQQIAHYIRGLFNLNPGFIESFIFVIACLIIYGAIGLPFNFFRGYLIEKKFELSTQSFTAWLLDQIKGLLVGSVLGTIVLTCLLTIFFNFGFNWWWIASIGAALFGVILTRLAPQIILPIFFKLTPIESATLQNRFSQLATRTGTPILGIFKIDLSRRTKAANAAVIGFGKSRKAVVGDTLLSSFSEDEVEFVLAHELAHHRYHDLWSGIALSSLMTTLALGLTHALLIRFAPIVGLQYSFVKSDFSPEILFWIALTSSTFLAVLNPIGNFYSRSVEARADRFAAETTQNKLAGAEAFKKLGYQNLAVFNPPVWEELLFYTHPSIGRRIRRLKT